MTLRRNRLKMIITFILLIVGLIFIIGTSYLLAYILQRLEDDPAVDANLEQEAFHQEIQKRFEQFHEDA